MDYRIMEFSLPISVKGFVVKVDDYYTIIINSDLSVEVARETILHELLHLHFGDLESHEPVWKIERRVQNALQLIRKKEKQGMAVYHPIEEWDSLEVPFKQAGL